MGVRVSCGKMTTSIMQKLKAKGANLARQIKAAEANLRRNRPNVGGSGGIGADNGGKVKKWGKGLRWIYGLLVISLLELAATISFVGPPTYVRPVAGTYTYWLLVFHAPMIAAALLMICTYALFTSKTFHDPDVSHNISHGKRSFYVFIFGMYAALELLHVVCCLISAIWRTVTMSECNGLEDDDDFCKDDTQLRVALGLLIMDGIVGVLSIIASIFAIKLIFILKKFVTRDKKLPNGQSYLANRIAMQHGLVDPLDYEDGEHITNVPYEDEEAMNDVPDFDQGYQRTRDLSNIANGEGMRHRSDATTTYGTSHMTAMGNTANSELHMHHPHHVPVILNPPAAIISALTNGTHALLAIE